jgi:hypothetical protein
MGEPAEWLAVKPHFGGRSYRLYSDRRHQLEMFSPSNCNFFVPFAQKDARFALAARRRLSVCPVLKKYPAK